MNTWASAGLVLMMCLISCGEQTHDISSVQVLDGDFRVIHVIEAGSALDELNAIWKGRSIVELSNRPPFSYSVDITFEDGTGDRWLYSSDGYMTVLSQSTVPIYEFERADELNLILIPSE